MKILFTMRTSDRSPKTNYLFRTLASLRDAGMAPEDVHVFPTSPDVGWLRHAPPLMTLHAPLERRTANQNGIAPIALLDQIDADWIVLSEDDLEWCPDPIGSMARWLATYATERIMVYRFFAFDRLTPVNADAGYAPLREQKGSQVVAMRANDARRFAAWAKVHPTDWRPKDAPFQHRPHDGFDKLLGYWALQERPETPIGLVSQPFFVKHLGVQSSLHGRGIQKDKQFIGAQAWR
jgi:hypothetical protein